MSSEYYFKQWGRLLIRLQETVDVDIQYQTTKAHDQKRCDAVHRLSGMLGKYISLYNQLVECTRMNLQVQKAMYMEDLYNSVLARIIELQKQIKKLEGSSVQFLSKSLIDHKLTTDDVELTDISQKVKRPEYVQQVLEDCLKKAKDQSQKLDDEEIEAAESLLSADERNSIKDLEHDVDKVFKEDTEKYVDDADLETKKKKYLDLIAAHEKARQTLTKIWKQKSQRETWKKELEGMTPTPARIELRERSARFIQRFARAYFESKRKAIEQCKRDKIIGFRLCQIPNADAELQASKISQIREQKQQEYESVWHRQYLEMKEKLYKKRADSIAEDYRDEIRDWFQKWYNQVEFFYDIPSEKKGGSALILREELPTPSQWREESKVDKAKNKSKNREQQKREKMAAKKEAQMKKKEERLKKRAEEALLKKMMKNPAQHPGYNYPESKKTDNIVKAIGNYRRDWDSLDAEGTLDVKEKSVKAIDENTAWMEIKTEVRTKVDVDMRNELKKLRIALKKDYERLEKEMPEMIPEPKHKGKKKTKAKDPFNKSIPDKLENLSLRGYLREYPRITFENIIGDPNFAGEDLRADLIPPVVIGAETRRTWWERCNQLAEGFQRILIMGPKGSGKTTLAYALATINGAAFFDLDLSKFDAENPEVSDDLQQLAVSIAACARAVQPSVIYIRHVQRLYYKKTPPEEPILDQEMLMRLLIKPLIKKIQKTDKITIIGTCVEPWLTKATQMLRQFPDVLLTPTTSYSLTFQILKTWMVKNRQIPTDLDVHSLAYMLQGYSFDFLTKSLQDFLTGDRIIKIAARGLAPEQVYDYVMENQKEEKPDYDKYLEWYSTKTQQGKWEQKQLADQIAYRNLEIEWQEKMAKKNRSAAAASSTLTQ